LYHFAATLTIFVCCVFFVFDLEVGFFEVVFFFFFVFFEEFVFFLF